MIDSTRREVFLCADCSSPRMVSTPRAGGVLQVVVHDDSCPRLAGMSEDGRYQPDEHGAVLHLAMSEVPAPSAGRQEDGSGPS